MELEQQRTSGTSHVKHKWYELSAGLVLPGVFGAELVFFFQILTHDLATSFGSQSPSWLRLKYGLGLWFVLYVCTSFMVTATNTNKEKYGGRSFFIDALEAGFSFAALAFLGFADVEVVSVFANQPTKPLSAAFFAIALIALFGVLHSSGPRHHHVTTARLLGGISSFIAAMMFLVNAATTPFLSVSASFIVADIALLICYSALIFYFRGRWGNAQ